MCLKNMACPMPSGMPLKFRTSSNGRAGRLKEDRYGQSEQDLLISWLNRTHSGEDLTFTLWQELLASIVLLSSLFCTLLERNWTYMYGG